MGHFEMNDMLSEVVDRLQEENNELRRQYEDVAVTLDSTILAMKACSAKIKAIEEYARGVLKTIIEHEEEEYDNKSDEAGDCLNSLPHQRGSNPLGTRSRRTRGSADVSGHRPRRRR